MRICRFDDDRLGLVLDSETVADVTEALDALPTLRWPLPPGDPLIAHIALVRPRIEVLAPKARTKPISEIFLRSPVATPSKVMAAPVNYLAHIQEARADHGIGFGADIKTIGHYGMFLKASSALVGPSEGVKLPALDRRMDHEVELALVIGKSGYRIPRDQAFDHIAGYAIGLDMTVRGTEDRSWRKSFDSFAVLGPWLVTADEVPNPSDLNLSIKVNGALRQSSNTRALIFDVPRLIEYASSAYALHPGDILMTGTPEGVGSVQPGDVMDCAIEGIGTMKVSVA